MTEAKPPRKKRTTTTHQPSPSPSTSSSPPPQQQNEPSNPGFSNEEQVRESSNAARKSLRAKRKAYEYMQAAMGAGDTEERQKLLQEALNREIEAESFGKTAKWIQSGAFQGFAYGCVPGITLGALTGTLVGGVVCLVTGGIGAGIGALRGPTFKLGDVVGQGIRKITGDLPGWEATQEQKDMLSRMVLDVKRQDMPSDEDLEAISEYEELAPGGSGFNQSWTEYATSYLPSFGSKQRQSQGPTSSSADYQREESQKSQSADALRKRMSESAAKPPASDVKNSPARASPRNQRSTTASRNNNTSEATPRERQMQQKTAQETSAASSRNDVGAKKTSIKPGTTTPAHARKKKPRKLEMRSG